MAKKAKKAKKETVVYQGESYTRGDRMTPGAYRLLNKDSKMFFVGSLVDTINVGKYRLAIFSVPK